MNSLRTIAEAYRSGEGGDGLRPGRGFTARTAYLAGRLSLRLAEWGDRVERKAEVALLNRAIQAAQGPNRAALEIIKTAKSLPHHAASSRWNRIVYLEPNGTVGAHQWQTWLGHRQAIDPHASDYAPLAGPLNPLEIQTPTGVLSTAVENLVITCTHPLLETPPRTRLHVNQFTYDGVCDSTAPASPVDRQVMIDIDEHGTVSRIAIAEAGDDTFDEKDPAQFRPHITPFLEGARTVLGATERMYTPFEFPGQ
jgi:hypothetical protein